MSRIISAEGLVQDVFVVPADDLPLPPDAVLVSLMRSEQEGEALVRRQQPWALELPNTADVRALPDAALRASLILIQFPGFADGRGYSQARLLREARGYGGILRATGAAVVRDQLQGMHRCGVTQFALREDQSIDDCLRALAEFTLAYQPALDALPQVRNLRRR